MAKEYDTAGKHLFDRHPRDWLSLLGWPLPPSDAGVSVVDSDVSTVSRSTDKLLRVVGVPSPYVAHFEFQSSGSGELDLRMLEYNALARGRHGLPVRSVAFLFRPAAGQGPTGRVDEVLDAQSYLHFAYRTVRLWELPVDALLNGPLGTVPLAPLAADLAEVPSVLDQVQARLRDQTTRDDMDVMLECTRVLMGLRFGPGQREPLMPSLQRLIEDESWVYRDTVEKGRIQGVAQGVAVGRHEQLLEMGTDKFGPPDAESAARLVAVTDVDELRRLGRRLLRANTWAELFAAD